MRGVRLLAWFDRTFHKKYNQRWFPNLTLPPDLASAMEQISATTPDLSPDLEAKFQALERTLEELGSAVVAFSGGIDSSLVAYLAHQRLGKKALAVTSSSESLNRDDLDLTRRLAAEWGMAHRVVKTNELQNPNYRANPINRCYFCKTTLYESLDAVAAEGGYAVVLNGTNVDDLGDHRPGLQAAREHGVRSPLVECGFTKADIRALARRLGLENAEKPQAACLSSRVPYGLAIDVPMLAQIEQAERLLRELGFAHLRVRHHGDLARIEVPPQDFARLLEHRQGIEEGLRGLGYRFVTLDLKGFRSGSLNEGLR